MRADNRLSRGDRELIAAYVSSRNKTVFCEHSHSAFAALQLDGGIELVEDVKRDHRGSHGSSDPVLRLIVETITCPDGTVSIAFTPDEAQGLIQTGSWMIVGGTGAFEGLHGSGEMEVVYDPADDSAARPTFTGTVTR